MPASHFRATGPGSRVFLAIAACTHNHREIVATHLMLQFEKIQFRSRLRRLSFTQSRCQWQLGAMTALTVALVLMTPLYPAVAEPAVGQPAADFALRSLGAANVRLSEHRGEVVLLNFWATWCGPCRQEMPLLNDLHVKYQRAGLTLFGVNIDASGDASTAQAAEMVSALKVTYPILIDARQSVGRLYEVDSMPLTVLIDRQGVVRYVSQGFKPGYEKRYAEWLRELLNE